MKTTKTSGRFELRGFTLIELLVVIAIISILAGMLLPTLARAKARSQRIDCVDNLKEISLGLRFWADDHAGKYPWQVDQTVGGGKPNGSDNATVNFQFCLASNELSTTRILVCPSDLQTVAATNFATCAITNTSYCLGNDADQTKPKNILATDRNISGFDFTGLNDNTSCYILNAAGEGIATWRKTQCHGANAGNLAAGEGSVQQLKNAGLLRAVQNIPSGDTVDGTLRFYVP